uniref:Uncharacterized protein n=1 Tax=Pseudo-nitzschia australis TaxID=44445 RepID=A0A7S4EHG5_9STRA|mmetsp:Transcript_8314/g.18329  ORF Transcript_8314/g.18329 Transcript_8314/m.18329 type:complete len:138 (+) Transcript_8314:360-773(+)
MCGFDSMHGFDFALCRNHPGTRSERRLASWWFRIGRILFRSNVVACRVDTINAPCPLHCIALHRITAQAKQHISNHNGLSCRGRTSSFLSHAGNPNRMQPVVSCMRCGRGTPSRIGAHTMLLLGGKLIIPLAVDYTQ